MTLPKTAIVLGTRPEIIKLSPIIRELARRGAPYFVVHTSQHHSQNMAQLFFDELRLGPPAYKLAVGSAPHGLQTGRMLAGLESVLLKEAPDTVLVQGDTNTVLAGALAASKQNICVGHVEAGLRSRDRSMPEEKNRMVCDALSDYLFCPTETQRLTLLAEGVADSRIFVTGNTIVDAVLQNQELAAVRPILEELGLEPDGFVLLTVHRAATADSAEALERLRVVIETIRSTTGRRVVWPQHPRTRANAARFGVTFAAQILEPLGYLDMLKLLSCAHLVATDSGGVQEEACIVRIPCVTLRENTERPETIDVGANRLAGLDAARVREAITSAQRRNRDWSNPFGDGRAAEVIVDVLERGATLRGHSGFPHADGVGLPLTA